MTRGRAINEAKAVNRLRAGALRVRQTIETMDLSDYDCNMSRFPNGCCHHGTQLLAYYLWESGWADLKVASGRHSRMPFHQHVWLLADGIILDITSDQFGERSASHRKAPLSVA
jgi:hypothetical protein